MTFHLDTVRLRACVLALLALPLLLIGLSPSPAEAQGYQIRSGDILRIEVLEDPSLNRTVLVAPDGRISVPSAGSLRAAGNTVEGVQRALTTRLEGNFASTPNVFVGIERLAERDPVVPLPPAAPETISVYVMGEATRPGKIEVEPGTSVLQMFAEMGGFTKFAATKRIQLRRNGTIRKLNYPSIEAGAASGRIELHDGNVILVPQRRLFE